MVRSAKRRTILLSATLITDHMFHVLWLTAVTHSTCAFREIFNLPSLSLDHVPQCSEASNLCSFLLLFTRSFKLTLLYIHSGCQWTSLTRDLCSRQPKTTASFYIKHPDGRTTELFFLFFYKSFLLLLPSNLYISFEILNSASVWKNRNERFLSDCHTVMFNSLQWA